jgi:hypothetical protein
MRTISLTLLSGALCGHPPEIAYGGVRRELQELLPAPQPTKITCRFWPAHPVFHHHPIQKGR